jgi:hypothetical protein
VHPDECNDEVGLEAEVSIGQLVKADISPDLYAALNAEGGGRIVLVTGAGSSVDWPTNLRSGAEYSEEAYHRLVEDGVLTPSECSNPRDLSLLAEVVYAKTASQLELIRRLPLGDWQAPAPNTGHLIAAALLIEGVLRSIVTLNYDLAFQVALGQLGKPSAVTIARGPEDHDRMGSRTLIYLHRSAECSPETWVLRKSDLEGSWKEDWEEVIASGALSAPATLFAGLGSPATVLTDTVDRLSKLGRTTYYFADPYPDNDFGKALSPFLSAIFQIGWTETMQLLSSRVAGRQARELDFSARRLAEENGLSKEGLTTTVQRLSELTIVDLGQLRSSWLLHDRKYMAAPDGTAQECLSDLVLAVSSICQALGAHPEISPSGVLSLHAEEEPKLAVVCVHGGGAKPWSSVLARLEHRWSGSIAARRPRVALVAGVVGADSLPQHLIHETPADDLVRGFDQFTAISVEDVRNNLLAHPSELRRRLAS